MSEPARITPPARVVGYVEAATVDAVLGWVWRPGQTERVAVELRLGDQVVARSVADVLRDDLAQNGIGDGRHAFSVAVPEQLRTRLGELRVVALPIDEEPVVLEAPPPAQPASDQVANLQRSVDMLIGSQRLIHRNLQAALLRQEPPAATSLAEVAAAQSALQESIATFELFAIRLEQALLVRETPTHTPGRHRALAAVAGVSGLALLLSGWALARVLLGG